jgi:hypothetical protein
MLAINWQVGFDKIMVKNDLPDSPFHAFAPAVRQNSCLAACARFIKSKLAALGLVLLAAWPCCSSADQSLQARFEKALADAKSIPNVEVEFVDKLTISDPSVSKALNAKEFSRTFQYSYLASGPKYWAEYKLISATQTNLEKFSKSTFDGHTYASYSGDDRQLVKGSKPLLGDAGQSPFNPLVAPFIFLSSQTEEAGTHILQFNDITSDEFRKSHSMPVGSNTNGMLEFAVSGPSRGGQPTHCLIGISEAGDDFAPTMIRQVVPGQKMEIAYSLHNYTKLGAYHFPATLEWTMNLYPPTSPPTLLASGTITLISARIPDQIADSDFKMDNEEEEAVSIWNWDQQNLTKSAPRDSNIITSCTTRTNANK